MNDIIPFELETERLRIRPYQVEDLPRLHDILNQAFGGETSLEHRRSWLLWNIDNYRELARLHQPPYGDYALELKATGELIGSIGLVQCIGPFDNLPYFQEQSKQPATGLSTTEMGLFWAIDPAHQYRGYASEGAGLLIQYAFENMWLKRIIATTEYDNDASMGVMRRLGMRIERNPYNEPFWFQVVGILENPNRPLETSFTVRLSETETNMQMHTQTQTQIPNQNKESHNGSARPL